MSPPAAPALADWMHSSSHCEEEYRFLASGWALRVLTEGALPAWWDRLAEGLTLCSLSAIKATQGRPTNVASLCCLARN